MRLLGLIVILCGTAGITFAGIVGVPEIDGASAGAAVALLTGGLLVLRGRRKQ